MVEAAAGAIPEGTDPPASPAGAAALKVPGAGTRAEAVAADPPFRDVVAADDPSIPRQQVGGPGGVAAAAASGLSSQVPSWAPPPSLHTSS